MFFPSVETNASAKTGCRGMIPLLGFGTKSQGLEVFKGADAPKGRIVQGLSVVAGTGKIVYDTRDERGKEGEYAINQGNQGNFE